jgi:putative membrane protein
MSNKIIIFGKGVLMGVCDLIPGISGGTIAFITGIYERLIDAVANITTKKYFNLVFSKSSEDRKRLFKELDVLFLILLFSGIFSAIILGSKVISYLIDNYYIYVFTFFVGLILASGLFISNQIKVKKNMNKLFGVFGFVCGILLLLFSPKEIVNPDYLIVVLSGFLAIFALFLPGISGSFILVILGMYEYVVNLVKNLDLINLIPFLIGAGLGVVVISRVVKFLFAFDKCKTLYFLLGLILGTLSIPLRNIYLQIEVFSFGLIFNLFVLAVFGFWVVKKLERVHK